jgi:drug/metabolite transporter (DMT)-like permease
VFFAALTALLFAASAVSATRTANLMGGNEANFWRLALSTLMLGIMAHVWGLGLGGGVFDILLISGIIGFGIGDVALFQALPRIGSRLTVMLVHCLTAPLAAGTEWLWMGTAMSFAEIACAVVILTGVAVALAPKDHRHIERKNFWWGIHWAVWAAIGQAGGVLLSRKAYVICASTGVNIDGFTVAYQRVIPGAIIAGICVLFVKRSYLAGWTRPEPQPADDGRLEGREKWRKSSGWLLANAITGATLGVSCYQWALKVEKPGVVLPIVALAPLLVIPMAYFLENERPSPRSLIGGFVAVAGSVTLAWVISQPG